MLTDGVQIRINFVHASFCGGYSTLNGLLFDSPPFERIHRFFIREQEAFLTQAGPSLITLYETAFDRFKLARGSGVVVAQLGQGFCCFALIGNFL